MQPSLTPEKHTKASQWVYASLTVIDGQRRIKPAQVASDRLLFTEPPHLICDTVQVIVTNGDQESRHTAAVLPHAPDATRIPIRLLSPQP